MERTEEDKVFKSPITAILGGKEYSIPLLAIKDARAWRKLGPKILANLPAYAKASTENPEGFVQSVTAMLVLVPDECTDLFFAYAKDLNRDEIESTANEWELLEAFRQVMVVGFPPLVTALTGALKR